MSAWILIVTTAWQFYSSAIWAPAVSVSMQEFGTQVACGRAADATRSQVAAQIADMHGIERTSVRAICVPKDAK